MMYLYQVIPVREFGKHVGWQATKAARNRYDKVLMWSPVSELHGCAEWIAKQKQRDAKQEGGDVNGS